MSAPKRPADLVDFVRHPDVQKVLIALLPYETGVRRREIMGKVPCGNAVITSLIEHCLVVYLADQTPKCRGRQKKAYIKLTTTGAGLAKQLRKAC